ncbi:MAG: hypothetical protein JWR81_4305 [Pseudonocardia sp.]|jgi:hypothetical protein|nr:hypothetical protein [Pseudonocardia sp.]
MYGHLTGALMLDVIVIAPEEPGDRGYLAHDGADVVLVADEFPHAEELGLTG